MTDGRPATGPAPAPSTWLTALEARAAGEYAVWRITEPLLERLPSGDGHPVLVLPGFTASDRSTERLRGLLRHLGYRTYGWGLGANLGPTPYIAAGLGKRLTSILDRESRPVSVIGWSLGGIYARELARSRPDSVRQVITMGSPIRMAPGDDSAASGLWNSLRHLHVKESSEKMMVGRRESPLPVPSTSIYTRTDGVVHWRTCLETKGLTAENVEVFGSHSGLGFNPAVALVVADRLAQTEGTWRKFRPPVMFLGAYPRAANWRG